MTPRALLLAILAGVLLWLLLVWSIGHRGDVDELVTVKTTDTTAPVRLEEPSWDAWLAAQPTTTTVVRRARSAPIVRPASVGRPVPAGDVWHAIAMCETGGTMNQRATSSTGKFLGFFQFSLSTWRGIGGPGDPRDQSYEVQRSFAVRLQARDGWSPWPTCARRLGLLR